MGRYTGDLNADSMWQNIVLRFGFRWTTTSAHFPLTKRLLEPGIKEIPSAIISILEPGKVAPWHEGPYKGVLRYHLGLEIPSYCQAESEPLCFLRVRNDARKQKTLHWLEGESILFDDTFPHV